MRYSFSYIAWIIVAVSWALALLGVCSAEAWCRVGGWIFLAAKGVMVLSTLLGVVRFPVLGMQIFLGRYRFDDRQGHALAQALMRYTWELPQTFVGYVVAQWRNILGIVDRVDSLGGVTFVTNEHQSGHAFVGMSIGCYANMWIPRAVEGDFEDFVRHRSYRIFMHEYGHSLDSHRWGLLYLPVVGATSLVSQLFDLRGWLNHKHSHCFVERLADYRARRYFNTEY